MCIYVFCYASCQHLVLSIAHIVNYYLFYGYKFIPLNTLGYFLHLYMCLDLVLLIIFFIG